MAATASRQPQHSDYTDPLQTTLIQRIAVRWELVILSVILLLAIFTRLYALGDRAMSHDESLHVYYSYELYMKGDFNHTPLMHGPILFHATALSYALFGDNDFTGRLYSAVLGIALVMTPLLFRRWLGRWGTIIACVMLLISPLLLYYNRYIRHDTPSILAAILMVWAAMMYISGPLDQRRKPRYLYVLSAAMLWNLGSKETAFIYIALFGAFFTLYWLFRVAQAVWKIPARQWFSGTMMAIVLGGIFAIAMYIIVDIVPLETVGPGAQLEGLFTNVDSRSFVLWTAAALAAVVSVIIATLLWAYRGRFSRVPWREFAMLTIGMLIVMGGLVVVEELAHITRDQIGMQVPLDPNAVEEGAGITGTIRWFWVLVPWVLMAGSLALFVMSRRKNAEGKDWWDWLHQFPELDVLWVMGTLILPWVTAVFIVSARGTPAEYEAIGNSFSFLTGVLPVQSPMQVGQFIVGGLCWLPLMITAIAAGLTWNWRRFVVCWLIFHSLFAFFFTTVFTNIPGLATGMIYSLQYWLEQQAERRGSQPQYYYTLIILPMYEFLPIIGSVAATFAGTFVYWVRRRRLHDLEDEVVANRKQLALAAVAEDDKPKNSDEADDAPAPVAVNVDTAAVEARSAEIDAQLTSMRRLDAVPFLLLVGFWAVLNIIFYTLAGEKMPWLGTHMTTPMIFLTAWFFGRIFDRIDWGLLRKAGWISLLIFPLGLAAVFQLVVLQLTGQGPFQGVAQFQLEWTYSWLAAAAVAVGVAWGWTYIRRLTSGRHVRQLFAVASFSVLGLVTFRSAWMASFIYYDYPNEFLVYAHATNGTKEVMNAMEGISRRTTDGLRLRFAYDNKLSWPGAWYFRQYPNAVYMGETPTLQVMENATVVLVGDDNRNVVEPLLEDRYQRFDFKRMWWPMQEYFGMTATRMVDLFDMTDSQSAQMRHGIWDIFWQRDYTKFGDATGRTFTFDRWPVAENMYMYVRKDVAAQVWPYGIGDGSVLNPIDQIEVSPCVANWQQYPATIVFDTAPLGGALDSPLGIDVTHNGRVLVAEVNANRISEFTSEGVYVRSFGEQGPADREGAYFERPHSVEMAANNSIVVVDTWNYQIRVFDPDYRQSAVWGQALTVGISAPADPFDGFWGPREVAIGPDGLVYIADTGNKRIRVYTPQGDWVRDIGRGGSGDGQIDEPTGIVIHPDGRVFVADTWNRRVAVFAASGTFIANYPVRAWYEEFGNRPYLALDVARDYLYVTDPDGGRVLVYSATDGTCIGAFGRLNREFPNTAEFSTIGGIDTDLNGNVYVVDLTQGRVLKFPPFPTPQVESEIEDPPGIGIPVDIPPAETPEVQG